jgi:hypothetical protein
MAKQNRTVPGQGADPVPQERSAPGKPKAWRAKCDCTYNGMYVRQGEIVYTDKMENPHFEKAEPEA